MKKYPLLLSPVYKSTIWGGDTLKREFNKNINFENIAESWELSVRENENTIISNGEYAGMLLTDYISHDRIGILGTNALKYDRFPLLIKFIDAADRLSIQVHPDNEYALAEENELGKTEMWYVVKAETGAQIVYGLKSGCNSEDFAKAISQNKVEEHLHYVDVHEGDVFYIPSGQIHAIGAGILIAEIQQNSDITYRVYDYNRRQADGSLRQLNTAKALAVMKNFSDEQINALRFSRKVSDDSAQILCSSEYFTSKKYIVGKTDTLEFGSNSESFISVLVLNSDSAIIKADNQNYHLKKGDSYFIPSDFEKFLICGKCEIILTEIN